MRACSISTMILYFAFFCYFHPCFLIRQSASVFSAAEKLKLKNPTYQLSVAFFFYIDSISSCSFNVIYSIIRTGMVASQGQNPRNIDFHPPLENELKDPDQCFALFVSNWDQLKPNI